MSVQYNNILFCVHKPSNHKFQDLTGRVFGRLVVLQFIGKTKSHKHAVWLCLCECNKSTYVTSYNLTKKRTISCGCRKKEISRECRTTHGEASSTHQSPEYKVYVDAKNRCLNPKNRNYSKYGGRGIKFNFTSFQDFLAVMGRKPTTEHSIERIDNNGHYEKGNVKWATRTEQANNKRNTYYITINGIRDSVSNWARKYGVLKHTVRRRIGRGWCNVCAVSNPNGVKCVHKTVTV